MIDISRIKDALDKKEECKRVFYPKEAAVIILMIPQKSDFLIILEKRARSLSIHSKQISFVGGSIDKKDKDPLSAAIREAEEEIGIRQNDVEVLGCLTPTVTKVSDFFIYPYVGILKNQSFNINSSEVERLILLPLNWLIEHHPFKENSIEYKNKTLKTFIIKYKKDVIWGATARILDDFIRRLKK